VFRRLNSVLSQVPFHWALYDLVMFYLDRQPAVHGGEFFDAFRKLVLAAIDTCVDDLLELED
jgi:hypothetical protein